MQKKDLKSGMVVVLRNGRRGLVLLNTSRGDIVGGCGDTSQDFDTEWLQLSGIQDNLKHLSSEDYDIMKIYDSRYNRDFGSLDIDELELIWERESKIIELTIDEIIDEIATKLQKDIMYRQKM